MKLILYVKEVETSNIIEDNHNIKKEPNFLSKKEDKMDLSIFDKIIEKLVNVKIIRF